MTYSKNKLLKIVNKNKQAEIECLKNLVKIPTCYNKSHDMKPMVNQLTDEFKKRGYKVESYQTSGAPVLVAELNHNMEKTLLFYNHYDVQPEEPLEEWKSAPYTLAIINERLYGRGVSDNKGPLVANIYGIQTAIEAEYQLNCNIRFIVEGEEEAGSMHLHEFCEAHPRLLKADGCIWEEASAISNQRSEISAGVKGNAYFELYSKGINKDAHSGDAPIVINPAWRLIWALATLKNQKEQILIENYYDNVVPPTKEELTLFATYPPEQIEHYKQKYETDNFLLGREGVEFWKELTLRPTCTISGLSAGWEGPGSKTVIGKTAMAKIDFRLVPNQKVTKVKEMLRKHLDNHQFKDIETRFLSGYEPAKTPINHPFIQMLAKTAKRFSGKDAILIPSSQGSGPAYLFGPYTPWAICETADPKANVHAPNESIKLEQLKNMTAFIAAIAIELGNT